MVTTMQRAPMTEHGTTSSLIASDRVEGTAGQRWEALVKLKTARDRKRATGSKVEGRKSLGEIDQRDHGGQMVELAKKLRRRKPKGGRRSL